jgi:ParB/RepB/Spo0J family partition protein
MTTITDTHPDDISNPDDRTDTDVDPDAHVSPDTGPDAASVLDGDGDAEGQMRDYAVEALAPHPDNPRSDLGDLTELARSIKAQGVLQPLLILPAGEDGRHLVVAGHRRLAAAIKAKRATVPAIVRDLTPAEVIEAFLIENGQRSDLTLSEEVRAIERLVDLSEGKLTVAKVSKRIGRSQGWVRARMALCALPPQWREAIDTGDLTLAAGEAAASVADLGPEHVEALCRQLRGHSWGDHGHQADLYRAQVEREAAFDAEVAKARRRRGAVVLTSDDDTLGCVALADFLSDEDAKAHRSEPCHAVFIERTAYGAGFERTNVCTDPDRHAATSGPQDEGGEQVEARESGEGSEDRRDEGGGGPAPGWPPLPRDPDGAKGPDLDSSHLKRKGRLARLGYAQEVWERPRGGVSQAQATRFALRCLVHEVSYDALRFAADILGIPEDERGWQLPDRIIEQADTPAALARIAAAVAAGAAECRMYHGYDGPTCRDWTALLTGAGWDPDPWTAAVLAGQAERAAAEQDNATDEQDNATDESEAETGPEANGPGDAAEASPGDSADEADTQATEPGPATDKAGPSGEPAAGDSIDSEPSADTTAVDDAG